MSVEVTPTTTTRDRRTDAWHRMLRDGRMEVMLKTPGFRLRCTAPEEQAWEAIELFERWTGLTVQSTRRARRQFVPPPGQLAMPELESL